MLKYISLTVDRLTKQKNGIDQNAALWQNQPITPAMIQEKIDELNAKQKAIDDKDLEIATLKTQAHALSAEGEKLADRVEALANGLEGNNLEKLLMYGIIPRKILAKKDAPILILHPEIVDDTDGEGFFVSTPVEPLADLYEWQKGIGADPSRTDIIPEMKLFKSTMKSSFVDDDVPKGVRIFYRVRAVNSAGASPWSEAVSRVQ